MDKDKYGCKNAEFLEDNILVGAAYWNPRDEVVGPYSDVDENGKTIKVWLYESLKIRTLCICVDEEEKQNRHGSGWSNMFSFPWEVSSYRDFTTRTEKGQHAIGCPGKKQKI